MPPSTTNPARSFGYDNAGNTTSDSYTATYSLAGRLATLLKAGVTTTYAVDGFGRIFYRWRRHRIKRKSGNIADFCASFQRVVVGTLVDRLFAVAGVANSVNIIDGFNGLASMCCVLILLCLAYVGFQVDDLLVGERLRRLFLGDHLLEPLDRLEHAW